MAKLRIFSYLENDVYTLRFENDPLALSNEDKQLMREFGEPEIDTGGTFAYGEGEDYTLPNNYVRVRSGFPLIRYFDAKGGEFSTDTLAKVEAYKDEIIVRFEDAFEDLRANLPSQQAFIGEQVVNV